MKIKITCPLGHICEKAENNIIERCAWLVEIEGKNPSSEEIIKDKRCSLAWMPILLVENAQTNRGQTAAVESLRNEQVSGQQQFLSLLQQAATAKLT